MIAPVLPPEHDPLVPRCGYFTGETTPAGCQALMRRYKAAINVVTAASSLRHHIRRSLDVGPRSKDVSKEAHLWRRLTETIEAFNKEAREP